MVNILSFLSKISSSKLTLGVAANVLGKFYVALTQIISIPIFIYAWGTEQFGVWLMLSTVPTYLALSDFGFSQAAAADITMKVAKKDFEAALVVFQSLWLLTLFIITGILGAVSFTLYFSDQIPSLDAVSSYATTLWLLILYAAFGQATRVLLIGFQSTGNYAFGTSLYDSLCFIEGVISVFIVLIGGDFVATAGSMLISRTVIGFVLYVALRRKVVWIDVGTSKSDSKVLRGLLQPALAAMALPLSSAINIQGIIIVIGAALTPSAVTSFSAVRTLSRIAVQLVGIFGRASMPEIASATALGDLHRVRRILAINISILGGVLLPAAIAFGFWGENILEIWTHGAVVPTQSFLILMALGLVSQGVWTFATYMLLAVNKHSRLALYSLIASLSAIFLSAAIAPRYGLEGVAFILLISDVLCLVVSLIKTRKI